MKPRFLADADLNQAILNGLRRREPSVDFLSAHAAGLRGLISDQAVLAVASNLQRILVSHDCNTMPANFASFTSSGQDSCGVILVPQKLDIGSAIEELTIIWLASSDGEWRNRIAWLPL